MSVVTLSFGRIGRSLAMDVGQFQLLYTRLAEWLAGHGIALAVFWADNLDSRLLLRVLQGISARLNTMLSFWLVVLLYVILGLLEVSDLGARIRRLADTNAARIIGGFELGLAYPTISAHQDDHERGDRSCRLGTCHGLRTAVRG